MSPQTFVAQNNGKKIGTGQCGELVDLWLVEGFGNHTEYASAKDYWFSGIPGFVPTTSPQAGAIAVYNAHPGFPDGHIAVYMGGGVVFEQNADPDGSLAHEFARANTYLLGYLTQGDEMYEGKSAQDWAAIANDATPYKAQVVGSNAWLDPNGFSDDVTRVTPHINNLMADRIAATESLGIPVTSGAAQITSAINALKSAQGSGTVLAPGTYQVK